MTYDASASTNNPIFYINGVVSATTVDTRTSGDRIELDEDSGAIGNVGAGGGNNRNLNGVLSDVRIYNIIRFYTKKYNNWLKKIAKEVGITKNVTCHIARHSFGNISGDKIPIQMLQKLYRHSDITTTINYQQSFINKDTDDALEIVIGSD